MFYSFRNDLRLIQFRFLSVRYEQLEAGWMEEGKRAVSPKHKYRNEPGNHYGTGWKGVSSGLLVIDKPRLLLTDGQKLESSHDLQLTVSSSVFKT